MIMKSEHPTYYETIVRSNVFKEWTKHAEANLLFDMPESIECGWLSDRHWLAFIDWVANSRSRKGGLNNWKGKSKEAKSKWGKETVLKRWKGVSKKDRLAHSKMMNSKKRLKA